MKRVNWWTLGYCLFLALMIGITLDSWRDGKRARATQEALLQECLRGRRP